MFLKKKNPKHLGMQKQFSSTLCKYLKTFKKSPWRKTFILTVQNLSIICNLEISAPEERQADQGQRLWGTNDYQGPNDVAVDVVNFQIEMRTDGAENGQSTQVRVPVPQADTIKQNFENQENLQQNEVDLADLINNPMNLQSSHNILDQILSNLQGLTPEQQE